MPSFAESYPELIATLAERFGTAEGALPPADAEPFARLVSAVAGRTLEPRKVARALDALREAGLLGPNELATADPQELAEAARLGGATVPTAVMRSLQRLARWLVECHQGTVESLDHVSTAQLREELLGVSGIGPASADAILLIGLGRPVYPVDRASYRILVRHAWIDPNAEYDEARALIEQQAPDDHLALARLSDWFERIGQDACRASVAKCERCPLKPYLPEGGPREPE